MGDAEAPARGEWYGAEPAWTVQSSSGDRVRRDRRRNRQRDVDGWASTSESIALVRLLITLPPPVELAAWLGAGVVG